MVNGLICAEKLVEVLGTGFQDVDGELKFVQRVLAVDDSGNKAEMLQYIDPSLLTKDMKRGFEADEW